MELLLEISLGHLRQRLRQTLVSVGGVALGVGFYIAVAALMQGSQDDFVQELVDSMPHITIKDEFRSPTVQPAERLLGEDALVAMHGLKPRDEVRGLRDYQSIMRTVERLDGVQTVAPALVGSIILRYGAKEYGTSLIGIDPEREGQVTNLEDDLIQGSLEELDASADGLIISRSTANRLGLAYGDRLSVVTTAGLVRSMKIVGLYKGSSSPMAGAAAGPAYVEIRKAQVLLDKPNTANQVRLRLADYEAAPDYSRRIEARIAYKAEAWQEENQTILSLLVIRNAILYAIVGAILVVASFGIFNVISTVVMEKQRDIAILKAMGFSRRDVEVLFLVEGLIVGIVGALIGWGVGWGLVNLLATITFEVEGDIERFPLDHSVLHYVLGSIFSILSASLAAYLPARKAAKLHPVDIIRGAA